MKEINFATSACRYCRFYEPQGRRGGCCQILDVPVEGSWKACSFASPPFKATLKKLEDIYQLKTSMPLNTSSQLASSVSKIKVEDNCPQMASPKSE
ncbi:MAG TPA: hypothetical protein V6C71_24750 [Coleofasciculaceae cyanobacterium]|jgi:hypothetical protein